MTHEQTKATCDQCYFRRAGLCALPGNTPCPTFRQARATERSRQDEPALAPRGPRVRVAV